MIIAVNLQDIDQYNCKFTRYYTLSNIACNIFRHSERSAVLGETVGVLLVLLLVTTVAL